jgi:Chaperone of endosialidase
MHKIALRILAALLALASPAVAQAPPVFPVTLPANTVLGRLGVAAGPAEAIPFASLGPLLLGNTTPHGIYYNNSGTVSLDPDLTWITGGPLTISPATASLTQGLVINQTGPNTGSQNAAVNFNSITVSDGVSSTGGLASSALLVQQNLQSNILGQKYALFVSSLKITAQTATTGDQIGTVSFAQTAFSNGGTNLGAGSSGSIYAINPIVSALSGATNYTIMSGGESDVQIFSGASTKYRFGYTVANASVGQGAVLDGGIEVASANTTGSFKSGMLFTSWRGGQALDSGGSMFNSDGVAQNITNILNFPNWTVTSNILNFANVTLTGAGILTTNAAGIGSTSTDRVVLQNLTAAGAGAQQWSPRLHFIGQGWKTNATAASQQVEFIAELQPVQGAANPTAFLLFSSQVNAGGFSGQASLSSAGVLNVLTGFQINSLAASNHVLVGNGTNYVDATNLAVAAGGTACSSASITCFNNITGYTASGATGTTSTNLVFSTSPSITTPTIVTSMVAPIIYGGTGAGSALFLESTSGAGTSDSIQFYTGSQVFAGGINSSGQWTLSPTSTGPVSGPTLIVNQNTLQVPNGGFSGSIVTQFGGAVNTLDRILMVGAGNSGLTGFFALNFLQSRGTFSSPTATQSGDIIGAFGMTGYGTSYQTSGGANILVSATETFTAAHGGTNIIYQATPNGTTTALSYFQLGGAGAWVGLNMGTGAGNGAICGATGITSTGGAITYQAGAACTVSLRQYKRNIEPLHAGLEEVMRLKPRQFFYLPGYANNGAMQQIGLVADEVEQVDPRLATYDDNGKLSGVEYVYAVTLAFRAIQELKADNDNLRTEIRQLRKEMHR